MFEKNTIEVSRGKSSLSVAALQFDAFLDKASTHCNTTLQTAEEFELEHFPWFT
jgi:hypothetical protein